MAANPTDISPQNVAQAFKEYKWCNSHSMNFEIHVGISRLEMATDIKASDTNQVPEDIYFTGYIVCNQIPMHETPISTQYCVVDDVRNNLVWDYVLSFPVKIRDLSLDSILVLTAWTPTGEVYGGTTMNFFDERGALKNGKQKLMFFFGIKGDDNVVPALNKTPGECYDYYFKWDHKFQMEKHYETYKANLSQIRATKQENKMEWLDRQVLARIQDTMGIAVNPYDLSTSESDQPMDNTAYSLEEMDLQTFCFLVVEMPHLQHPILHEEKQYPAVTPHVPPTSMLDLMAPLIVDFDENVIEFSLVGRAFNPSMLTVVADWDMDEENLAEDMNRKLSQYTRRGDSDATAKPNLAEKEKIDKIIQNVGNHMSVDEIDLLYRYRYSLTDSKKALTKFLFAVNWEAESEVAELPTLFALWSAKAPIDVADALKLLSKEKSFEHPFVREYAVEVLRSAADEELLSYLLQLVQALRYEPTPSTPAAPVNATIAARSKPTPAGGESTRAVAPTAATAVAVDLEHSIVGINHMTVGDQPVKAIPVASAISESIASATGGKDSPKAAAEKAAQNAASAGNLSPLANFLIDRACHSPTVANYLYWYLKVEIEDEASGQLFESIFEAFIVQLAQSGPEQSQLFKRLLALDDYIAKISACQRDAREARGNKPIKEQALQRLLQERKLDKIASSVDWVPMPLEPSIKLTGLNAGTAMMFASAVYPCVIEFYEFINPAAPVTAEGEVVPAAAAAAAKKPKTHKIMFKSGDDLRQDQLVMQMISLMDRLLKKVNLDLKLLTYGILAVGQRDGIMEFVRNSMAISGVLKKHASIQEYLKIHNPDKSGPFEMSAVALDTFIKSCAGYCVITYILGIGDRHLDNIMINTSGQMFHIDFGFILGQDPKPLPPPFRLTRSMADAMGGEESEHYARFKSLCCQSYNWLRKSAHLVLNLLSLMGDAGIQDISKRSELPKVLMKVEEKFRLDLTDEQAEQFFLGLINESLHSLAPKIMEGLHIIAVSMR